MDDAPATSASHHIEVARTVHPESRDAIARGLYEFNARHFGEYQFTDLDVYVRDADGRIIGGLIGQYWSGWLSIHALWVAEELRGSGIGTGILKAAEDAAVQSGCHAAILDTLSFQAPAFYEKRGYVRIGVVENYRAGAQEIFLQKRLHADPVTT
ncbi:MAG TPA: GNAT family N-acetyltransferase [Bryobacteraceae bacterium]|jgi:GNAT superfamily N-acetyltransferase